MNKLKYYLTVFLISGIAKIIGKVWVFACIPFRAYARNYVYNYILQNNLELPRLYAREPARVDGGWKLREIPEKSRLIEGQPTSGFIKYRKVNKAMYLFVVFVIWGWLDDDSGQDTTAEGYIRTLLEGGGRTSWHEIFRPFLKKADFSNVVYGNSFDLGDIRAEHPFYNFWCTLVWNDRNSAMNFRYKYIKGEFD